MRTGKPVISFGIEFSERMARTHVYVLTLRKTRCEHISVPTHLRANIFFFLITSDEKILHYYVARYFCHVRFPIRIFTGSREIMILIK